jgi:hypothetical protein
MLRNSKRALWMLLWLAVASALWALDVEVTYERNVRRGVPANFQLQNPHRVAQWRA